MKLFQHISLKRFTALSMMAMLLFINVLKAFHTHGIIDIKNASALIAKQGNASTDDAFSKNLHCNVCEFQLARDADALAFFPAVQPLHTGLPRQSGILQTFSYVHQPVLAGRGPPAIQGLV